MGVAQRSHPLVRTHLSGSIAGTIVAGVMFSGLLIATGAREYPGLHSVLDTGIFMLSGVLALFFWNVGGRTGQKFAEWMTASLAITCLLCGVHMVATVEWSGRLALFARSARLPLDTSQVAPAYIFPVGLAVSAWLAGRDSKLRAYRLALRS